MIVHVEQDDGTFQNLNTFAATHGFKSLGAEVVFFDSVLQHYRRAVTRETPVVGSIRTVHKALQLIGVKVPEPLDYPESLRGYLRRSVRRTTFGECRRENFRGFVKPVAHKLFTGQVFFSYYNTEAISDDEPVWAASPIGFSSEYRCFVLNRELVGVHFYKGDFSRYIDVDKVRKAIEEYEGQPVAYALDFGFADFAATVLVEVNDAYALGSYGLNPVTYAKMIAARWEEMCYAP